MENLFRARPIILLKLFVLTATVCIPCGAYGQEQRVAHFRDGTHFESPHLRVDAQADLHFTAHEEPIPRSRLVYWGYLEENLLQTQVILVDGSCIVADVLAMSSTTVTMGTNETSYTSGSIWQRVEVPRSAVQAIVFHPPTGVNERDRILDELAAPRNLDQAWLENGDRLSGTWLGPFTAESFTNAEAIWTWKVGDRELSVPRSQVLAIALSTRTRPQQTSEQGRGAIVGFAEGTRLVTLDAQVSGTAVQFLLAGDIRLTTTPGIAWDEICYYRPEQPTVHYLSDLEPLGYRHVPQLTLNWPYGKDRNVEQGRLRTATGLYEKGLGMHSVSRLAYELPRGAERLQLELALDRSAGERGSVQLRIYTQSGTSEWQQVAESPIVRGGDPPFPMNVMLQGAERIALILAAADRGQEQDRANVLNARVISK